MLAPMNTNSGPRRVLLLAPYLESPGGMASVARFLHRAIESSGRYRSTVISIACSSADDASVLLSRPATWFRGVRTTTRRWDGVTVPHVGAFLADFEFRRYRPRRLLTRLLDEHDLVQVVAGTPVWALLAARTIRPVVLQVATLTTAERKSTLARGRGILGAWRRAMARITARLDLAALRHVDAVFVENRWMDELLRRRMPEGSVHFAPPGVDTRLFRPREGGPAGGPVLCVGRLADPRKNVGLLFEAYARLRREAAQAPPLLLAGSTAPSDEAWAVAAAHGIRDHVEFRGGLSDERLAELFREASMFVLSSDEEGLGLVVLEAMASGLPVVSTDCGGPSTAIEHGRSGFLVPVGDAAGLASHMRDLLDDPGLRDAIGRQARARAEAEFSYEAAGRPFLDCYDRLLEARADSS